MDDKLLSKADVEHLATLSRLALNEGDIERYTEQLNSVFEVMAVLNSVDTEGLAETAQVTGLTNIVRDDQAGETLTISEVLANAPQKSDRHFIVPDVL